MPQLVRNFPYLFFFPHSVYTSSSRSTQKAFLSPIPGVVVVTVRPFTSEALHLTKSVTICLAETTWDHQNNPPPPHNEQICSTAQLLIVLLVACMLVTCGNFYCDTAAHHMVGASSDESLTWQRDTCAPPSTGGCEKEPQQRFSYNNLYMKINSVLYRWWRWWLTMVRVW